MIFQSTHTRTARRMIAQLLRLEEHFGCRLVTTHQASLRADLTSVLKRGCLEKVLWRLKDSSGARRFEFEIGADGEPTGPIASALERGGHLPDFADRGTLSSHVVVRCRGAANAKTLINKLSLRWREADKAPPTSGQRLLWITRAGNLDYAFAETADADGPAIERVFCHKLHAPQEHTFSVGQQFRARIVQTERGPQARSIQLLA